MASPKDWNAAPRKPRTIVLLEPQPARERTAVHCVAPSGPETPAEPGDPHIAFAAAPDPTKPPAPEIEPPGDPKPLPGVPDPDPEIPPPQDPPPGHDDPARHDPPANPPDPHDPEPHKIDDPPVPGAPPDIIARAVAASARADAAIAETIAELANAPLGVLAHAVGPHLHVLTLDQALAEILCEDSVPVAIRHEPADYDHEPGEDDIEPIVRRREAPPMIAALVGDEPAAAPRESPTPRRKVAAGRGLFASLRAILF